MTKSLTRYVLARDITGAAGDVLSFSDTMLEANEGQAITIPTENGWYVAEFSILPAIGNISITTIIYNEQPELLLPGIQYTTSDLYFRRLVKGGSTIVFSRFRGSVDPIANYSVYLYKMTM